MMRTVILIAAALFVPAAGFSATFYVPDHYGTIQEAIDNAQAGDTLIVRPAVYMENIDFLGKSITVQSEKGPDCTVIDGNQSGSAVTFENGEGTLAVLEGFTVTNGSGTKIGLYRYGGGVYLAGNAMPKIRDNMISGNSAHFGAGLFGNSASPEISANTIQGNVAESEGGAMLFLSATGLVVNRNRVMGNSSKEWGGGIEVAQFTTVTVTNNIVIQNKAVNKGSGGILLARNCNGTIANNLICGNSVKSFGAGIDIFFNSQATITNNTIHGNTGSSGGGIACRENSTITITDTILWNNEAAIGKEIFINAPTSPSTVTIDHSDLEGGQSSVEVKANCVLNWGPGMIDGDPLFYAGPSGFHYLSQVAAGQALDSPCLDAGSGPASNVGMDTLWTRTDEKPDSGTVDLGFHFGSVLFPRLQSDGFEISESTGGTVRFLLLAGQNNANRSYLLLGSASGTQPGTPLPGGNAALPLNWDLFTSLVVLYANSPVFSNFLGFLDGLGASGRYTETGDNFCQVKTPGKNYHRSRYIGVI